MSLDLMKIKIAEWLLDPDRGTKSLPLRVLPLEKGEYRDASDLERLEAELKKQGLWKVYSEIELPLSPILEEMHETGIAVDRAWLAQESKKYAKELAALEAEIYKTTGKQFNINSPKQLSEILFSAPPAGLGLAAKGVAKTKAGGYSTDITTLELIRALHPAIASLLRYRELFKLKSTYLDPLQELADRTCRVHTTYLQTGTATGRLSSENPNLQNVPPEIKPAFVAREGWSLAAFDYSQIELRVLASVSGDEKMMTAFGEGRDIHAMTAAQIYNVPLSRVTKERRHVAKTLNFGMIYGMGPAAFAAVAGISRDEAQNFMDEYFVRFSEVRMWQEKILQEARAAGMVININGRRRLLPSIASPNRRYAAEAERQALNFPIQSAAADIMKLALIRVRAFLTQRKLEKRVHMLLTIHDELLIEAEEQIVTEVVPEIRREMESAYALRVPLIVKATAGKRWSEL